ncbi:MAG: hypothetical protein DSZ11_04025, partial [Sulfurovum sp.]
MMQKVFYILIISTVFMSTVFAKNSSQDWSILYNGSGSIVEVYDHEKKTKVIEFSSQSNRDTYINGARKGKKAWKERKSRTLKWSFKYSQNYVIIVTLTTIKGYRSLVYTANDKNFKSYIGLGSHTIQGEWVTITRNLEEDLRQQDPTNKILSVNGFAIRGEGRIADIHMLKVIKRSLVRSLYRTIQEALTYLKNKQFLANSLTHKEPKKEHILSPNKDVPTITLINGNKIYLDLGNKFIDPGVIAEDSNGVPLDVEVFGDVNVSQVNSYPLQYLAIDKNGNATSVTRTIVIVSKDIKDIKPKKVLKKETKKELEKETKEESIENNNSEGEINSEEEKLEDIYRKDRGEEEEEQSEQQEEIDAIFANAEGDTQEEKLED